MMNKNGATLLHLSFLPVYFVQRSVAQLVWCCGVLLSERVDLEVEMAGYLKELGYGA
ncbi:hypothetical protein [Parendozoicomonas sp. Alg238-R29]|uniref:hypothetical protein n=1 Tax=Parendozoicomonas sp. Alg238-R29 TaxID=2993446 RepID=UPI00248F464C|nr:hypothetical protein [Parendozoicomonas sp. Alg238-R29]